MRYIVVAAVAFILVGVGAGLRSSEKCKSCSPGAKFAVKIPWKGGAITARIKSIDSEKIKTPEVPDISKIPDIKELMEWKKRLKVTRVIKEDESKKRMASRRVISGDMGYPRDAKKYYIAELMAWKAQREILSEYHRNAKMLKGDDLRKLKLSTRKRLLEARYEIMRKHGTPEQAMESKRALDTYTKFYKKIIREMEK